MKLNVALCFVLYVFTGTSQGLLLHPLVVSCLLLAFRHSPGFPSPFLPSTTLILSFLRQHAISIASVSEQQPFIHHTSTHGTREKPMSIPHACSSLELIYPRRCACLLYIPGTLCPEFCVSIFIYLCNYSILACNIRINILSLLQLYFHVYSQFSSDSLSMYSRFRMVVPPMESGSSRISMIPATSPSLSVLCASAVTPSLTSSSSAA